VFFKSLVCKKYSFKLIWMFYHNVQIKHKKGGKTGIQASGYLFISFIFVFRLIIMYANHFNHMNGGKKWGISNVFQWKSWFFQQFFSAMIFGPHAFQHDSQKLSKLHLVLHFNLQSKYISFKSFNSKVILSVAQGSLIF